LGDLVFVSSLFIVVINSLSDVQLSKNFSYSVGGIFNLKTISFVVQKLFNFNMFFFFSYEEKNYIRIANLQSYFFLYNFKNNIYNFLAEKSV
jgi:hypothetical protein